MYVSHKMSNESNTITRGITLKFYNFFERTCLLATTIDTILLIFFLKMFAIKAYKTMKASLQGGL